MSQPTIVLHHLNNSKSIRIIWLLEELKLQYTIKEYQRQPDKLAPPELYKIHPLGKAPVVTIEENGQTVTLAESGAITEYLTNVYGKETTLGPKAGDSQEYADYLYWLHYTEGSLSLPLFLQMLFTILPQRAPFLVKPVVSGVCSQTLSTFIQPRLKSHYDFIEEKLSKSTNKFLFGERLTSADILMSFPIYSLTERGDAATREKYPNLYAYAAKLKELSGQKKAEEVGGKYDFAYFLKG